MIFDVGLVGVTLSNEGDTVLALSGDFVFGLSTELVSTTITVLSCDDASGGNALSSSPWLQ